MVSLRVAARVRALERDRASEQLARHPLKHPLDRREARYRLRHQITPLQTKGKVRESSIETDRATLPVSAPAEVV